MRLTYNQNRFYDSLYALIFGEYRNPVLLDLHKSLILSSSVISYFYAIKTNQPFPLGEPIIATSAEIAFEYAKDVLKGRFELGEPIIATDSLEALQYARHVIKQPFPLGEPAIAKDGSTSVPYAKFVLKGKFELGEKVIAESTRYSFWYALEILKGRFYLGEQKMCLYPDDPYTQQYIIHFGELRYKRYEELFETNTSR